MRTREQRDLFPSALEMTILRTLKRQPLHGYVLTRHIKRTSRDSYRLKKVRCIRRSSGHARRTWSRSSGASGPRKSGVRIYKLTAKGAKHREHEVSRFERMLEGITRVLAAGES